VVYYISMYIIVKMQTTHGGRAGTHIGWVSTHGAVFGVGSYPPPSMTRTAKAGIPTLANINSVHAIS